MTARPDESRPRGPPPLPEGLLDPAAYPRPPASVRLLETHISWLFFAGDRVYKVKKPVRFPFLDATRLEERRRFCEEEVRLNAELAPDVYLRVLPLRRGATGWRVGEGAPADEYAVEMRRLPEEGMLDRALDRGNLDPALLDELAAILVRFHARAATGPGIDEQGSADAIAERVFETLDEDREHLPPRLDGFLRARIARYLVEHRPLLRRRVAEGRIREGHGDLHAGNICRTPRGIVIYDRIEFSKPFRCGDVAYDIAFLAMDLDFRGRRDESRRFVRRYAELARDPEVEALTGFYKIHRALVRGLVSALQGDGARARRYFGLAAGYALPPALVLTCGLPASGKSTYARALACELDAETVRSDVVRKTLLGIPPTAHPSAPLDAGPYAPEATERTYARLLEEAERILRAGRSAILDATFPTRERRAPFRDLAARLGLPCVVAHLEADEAEISRRLAARQSDPTEVSDAGLAVYRRAKETFEPPGEFPATERVSGRGDLVYETVLLLVALQVEKEGPRGPA